MYFDIVFLFSYYQIVTNMRFIYFCFWYKKRVYLWSQVMKTLKTFCGLQPGHFSFKILRDVDLTFLYQEKYVNSKNIFLRFTALF